jgi:hypothetical protein
MNKQERRCRDCAHAQMCVIHPQFKLAFDRTFQHITEERGEDSFMAKQMELLARYCKHFERATKAQKVLPINRGEKL